MRHTYEITPRPQSVGGGWRLRLQEDGQEVGGDIFPVVQADPQQIAAWWAGLTDEQRVAWLDRSGGITPADAHLAHASVAAYDAAEAAARKWLDSRPR